MSHFKRSAMLTKPLTIGLIAVSLFVATKASNEEKTPDDEYRQNAIKNAKAERLEAAAAASRSTEHVENSDNVIVMLDENHEAEKGHEVEDTNVLTLDEVPDAEQLTNNFMESEFAKKCKQECIALKKQCGDCCKNSTEWLKEQVRALCDKFCSKEGVPIDDLEAAMFEEMNADNAIEPTSAIPGGIVRPQRMKQKRGCPAKILCCVFGFLRSCCYGFVCHPSNHPNSAQRSRESCCCVFLCPKSFVEKHPGLCISFCGPNRDDECCFREPRRVCMTKMKAQVRKWWEALRDCRKRAASSDGDNADSESSTGTETSN